MDDWDWWCFYIKEAVIILLEGYWYYLAWKRIIHKLTGRRYKEDTSRHTV
jgi:hypothetical protein